MRQHARRSAQPSGVNMRKLNLPPADFGSLPGTYVGDGVWTDIAEDSKSYRVSQSISILKSEISVEYTHDFYEEGTSKSGVFVFQRQAGALLRVFMKGAAVGNGYMFGDYLHYYIKVGEIYVQASYRRTASGLLVNGSSSSNSKGRFIAWHEDLWKQGDA